MPAFHIGTTNTICQTCKTCKTCKTCIRSDRIRPQSTPTRPPGRTSQSTNDDTPRSMASPPIQWHPRVLPTQCSAPWSDCSFCRLTATLHYPHSLYLQLITYLLPVCAIGHPFLFHITFSSVPSIQCQVHRYPRVPPQTAQLPEWAYWRISHRI